MLNFNITLSLKHPALHMLSAVVVLLSLLLCTNTNAASVLKVGVYDNSPTIFMDQHGKPDGLFIEILEDIALKEGWKLEYVYGQWTEVYEYLMRGEIDLLPAIALSNLREKFFNFTDETVMANWAQLYGPNKSNIGSLLDLQGK